MKNVLKSVVFIIVFVILIELFNLILIPKYKLFGMNNYEISSEKDNTLDVLFLGDSLVYSSVSPMNIWNEYGYTSFDCSEAAQLISDAYKYFEYALKSQSPKVVMLESNILFRDSKNMNKDIKYAKMTKKYASISIYHDNWKKYMKDGSMDKWINIDKGYKYITNIKPAKTNNYIEYSNKIKKIPSENIMYFERIIDICKKNNIKLVLFSIPSQKSWWYSKHNSAASVASKYNLDYFDLNLENIGINWKKDTKDRGSHLNYLGAQKVSTYIGNYLKNSNLLIDHRKDILYNQWHKAYKLYKKKSINN